MNSVQSAQMEWEYLKELRTLVKEGSEQLRKMHDEKTRLFESMLPPITTNLKAIGHHKIVLLATTIALVALQLVILSGQAAEILVLPTGCSIILSFGLSLMTYSQLHHKEQHLKTMLKRQQELFSF